MKLFKEIKYNILKDGRYNRVEMFCSVLPRAIQTAKCITEGVTSRVYEAVNPLQGEDALQGEAALHGDA